MYFRKEAMCVLILISVVPGGSARIAHERERKRDVLKAP